MLNCEHPGMLNVARIAEIAGDPDWLAQCLYRAARRMVAVTARLPFKYYAVETGFISHNPKLIYGTGFSEKRHNVLPCKALQGFPAKPSCSGQEKAEILFSRPNIPANRRALSRGLLTVSRTPGGNIPSSVGPPAAHPPPRS